MNILEEKDGEVLTLAVNDRLDSVTSPDFEKRFLEIIDGGERFIVVDLSEVDYMNSAGLKAILMAANGIQPKARRSETE